MVHFNWSPVVHYPWSGGVERPIAPNTDWFFGSIAAGGGNAGIEQRVFEEVACYGKQLGLITEILLDIAAAEVISDKARQSLTRLKEIAGRIEEIKTTERETKHERLKDSLLSLRKRSLKL